MNAVAIKYIGAAFSMKRELKLVFFTFGILCFLPFFTVVLLTQVGINFISGTLVTSDPQTHEVQIHDPRTGEVVDRVSGPFAWPVSGPVTVEFAGSSPYQPYHSGIDIASSTKEVGDPIGAFMKGKVIKVKELKWGYGKYVVIDHGHQVTSVYAHLDSIGVEENQDVELGTIVGTRGTTGWSTGPHLHFEIRVYGIPVNPRTFLEGDP